jgi:hypothetical protein
MIDHFRLYPLATCKQADFLIWSNIIDLMLSKSHLTSDGFKHCLAVMGN